MGFDGGMHHWTDPMDNGTDSSDTTEPENSEKYRAGSPLRVY